MRNRVAAFIEVAVERSCHDRRKKEAPHHSQTNLARTRANPTPRQLASGLEQKEKPDRRGTCNSERHQSENGQVLVLALQALQHAEFFYGPEDRDAGEESPEECLKNPASGAQDLKSSTKKSAMKESCRAAESAGPKERRGATSFTSECEIDPRAEA